MSDQNRVEYSADKQCVLHFVKNFCQNAFNIFLQRQQLQKNVRSHFMEKTNGIEKGLLDMTVAHLFSSRIYSFCDNCTVFSHH